MSHHNKVIPSWFWFITYFVLNLDTFSRIEVLMKNGKLLRKLRNPYTFKATVLLRNALTFWSTLHTPLAGLVVSTVQDFFWVNIIFKNKFWSFFFQIYHKLLHVS